VVQEVLLEASRRLSDYLKKPDMSFHLWLRHIARDHLIDAHRRHRAQKRGVQREQPAVPAAFADRSSIELAGQFIDQGLTPASATIRAEMGRRLHAALAQLDEADRATILMRPFRQLSKQAAATHLALT